MTRTILMTILSAAILSGSMAQAGPALMMHCVKGTNIADSGGTQTDTRQQNRRVQSGKIKL